MPNPYFKFKQFTIWQAYQGLKVTTDGCLLGAIATCPNPKRILDIGTGTGLLALMLAQKYPTAEITGIDVQPEATDLAAKNFASSPWASNLKVVNQRIQEFSTPLVKPFDLIISNPPFFAGHLPNQDSSKALALHNDGLPIKALLEAGSALLTNEGCFWMMYPAYEADQCLKLAEAMDFFLAETWLIYNSQKGSVFRKVMCLKKQQSVVQEQELIIRTTSGTYTNDFIELLKPYYLYL